MFPSPFPDPSRPPRCWTLATYNVQDLFDTAGTGRREEPRPTENRLQNKLTRLARSLRVLDADIVGLMEVENQAVLSRLNAEALAGLGYRETVLVEGNDPERGIDVALLSRFPVVRVLSHTGDLWTGEDGRTRRLFSRDCLQCHLRLPSGETLVVLVNHFKSKRGGGDEGAALRTAQAARVREIADSLSKSYPLVAILGDLNDTPGSPALSALLADGRWADVAGVDVPESHAYTFVHWGQPERIDYLLASPTLRQRLVPHSTLISHDGWARRASDHFPLRAAFGPVAGDAPAYAESLTAAYDRLQPPAVSGSPRRAPAFVDAAHFSWRDVSPLEGQTLLVTGRVLHAEETRGVGTIRLLLGSADPLLAFRVTVPAEDLAAWARAGIPDPTGYYNNQRVRVVGTLGFYGNAPEILARRPHQIRKINL